MSTNGRRQSDVRPAATDAVLSYECLVRDHEEVREVRDAAISSIEASLQREARALTRLHLTNEERVLAKDE